MNSPPPSPIVHAHIRILFYGDSALTHLFDIGDTKGPLRRTKHEFGLSLLKDVLESSIFPRVSVTLLNRFWDLKPEDLVESLLDVTVDPRLRKPGPSRL